MKFFLTAVLSCAFTSVLQAAGFGFDSWVFWIEFVLILALIVVQYIPREGV